MDEGDWADGLVQGGERGGLTASLSYAYIQYIGSYDSCYWASEYGEYTLVKEKGG